MAAPIRFSLNGRPVQSQDQQDQPGAPSQRIWRSAKSFAVGQRWANPRQINDFVVPLAGRRQILCGGRHRLFSAKPLIFSDLADETALASSLISSGPLWPADSDTLPKAVPSSRSPAGPSVRSRFLLRPGPLLNEIILGALARAKKRYGPELSAFIFLSNHLHILVRVDDSKQLARFMGYFLSKLAREVTRLTGWRDKVFARRFQAIPVSEEEGAQVGRLIYILSHGCKEDLVETPQEWPGVHCVNALLTGQSLSGTWFDRTQEFAARNRGENFSLRQYAKQEELELDPLPCWRHLSPEQYRAQIATLVETIAAEARARRQGNGIKPLGPAAILAQDPLARPRKSKRSSAPRVHAASKLVRKAMYEAYAWFVACFREAAAKLRAGDRLVRFPEGSFPPGLPFVAWGTAG